MMLLERVHRVVIAGVGLMGGSIGLALKRAGFQGKVVGLGRRWSSLKRAIDAGAVDSTALDFAEALTNADLLVISTPVDVITIIAKEAIKHAPVNCVITDVGSTKGRLVAEIDGFMPDEKLIFSEEIGHKETFEDNQLPWKIIISDDEEEVHAVTRMVLHDYSYDGRPLKFLSAFTEEQTVMLMKEITIHHIIANQIQ